MEKIAQTPESKEILKLSFRKATSEDADAFVALEDTVSPGMYNSIFDTEGALEEFAKNEVYLIYKGDELVGSTEFRMISPDHAHLASVVVHPDYQGQGIAREAALFRLEKLKGVKKIDLVTHPENFKIINLYQSLGFKIEGQIEKYFAYRDPGVVLVRETS